MGRRIKGKEGRKEKSQSGRCVWGERRGNRNRRETRRKEKREEEKRKERRKKGKEEGNRNQRRVGSRTGKQRTWNCATRSRFSPTPVILHLEAT